MTTIEKAYVGYSQLANFFEVGKNKEGILVTGNFGLRISSWNGGVVLETVALGKKEKQGIYFNKMTTQKVKKIKEPTKVLEKIKTKKVETKKQESDFFNDFEV